MSMLPYIVGVSEPDEKYRLMHAAWNACRDAGVTLPVEVSKFFKGKAPSKRGVDVELDDDAVVEWNDAGTEVFDVKLDRLPARVTIVRFYSAL